MIGQIKTPPIWRGFLFWAFGNGSVAGLGALGVLIAPAVNGNAAGHGAVLRTRISIDIGDRLCVGRLLLNNYFRPVVVGDCADNAETNANANALCEWLLPPVVASVHLQTKSSNDGQNAVSSIPYCDR